MIKIKKDPNRARISKSLAEAYYGMSGISEEVADAFRSFEQDFRNQMEIVRDFGLTIIKFPYLKYYLMRKRNGRRYKMRVIWKWINRDLKKRRKSNG